MAHYKNKTKETDSDVAAFLQTIPDEKKKVDALTVLRLMQEASGHEPKMWGPSIIGFGSFHYKYKTGHEGDSPLIGFSPRKTALTLYLSSFPQKDELLKGLGKHKVSKACLYINKLQDVDIDILKEMIRLSLEAPINPC